MEVQIKNLHINKNVKNQGTQVVQSFFFTNRILAEYTNPRGGVLLPNWPIQIQGGSAQEQYLFQASSIYIYQGKDFTRLSKSLLILFLVGYASLDPFTCFLTFALIDR